MQSLVGGDSTVKLNDSYFDTLNEEAGALATFVENKGDAQELLRILRRFAEIGYASTGNGYYLVEKGALNP